jgi:hypothetical protein
MSHIFSMYVYSFAPTGPGQSSGQLYIQRMVEPNRNEEQQTAYIQHFLDDLGFDSADSARVHPSDFTASEYILGALQNPKLLTTNTGRSLFAGQVLLHTVSQAIAAVGRASGRTFTELLQLALPREADDEEWVGDDCLPLAPAERDGDASTPFLGAGTRATESTAEGLFAFATKLVALGVSYAQRNAL